MRCFMCLHVVSCNNTQINNYSPQPVGPMTMVRRFLATASISCLLVLSNMVGRVMFVEEAALEGVSVSTVPVIIGDCFRSVATEGAKPTDPGWFTATLLVVWCILVHVLVSSLCGPCSNRRDLAGDTLAAALVSWTALVGRRLLSPGS